MGTLREIAAPRSGSPAGVAVIVLCVIAGVALLSFETSKFARLAHYDQRLGRPMIGRLYNPFASIGWMLQFELMDGAPKWIHEAFNRERSDLAWGFVTLGLVAIVLASALEKPKRNSDLHGQAVWATTRDIRRSPLAEATTGVVVGETKDGDLLIHDGIEHVLVLGPPGAGKSDGIAIPTLMRAWPHSTIVFDPAEELKNRTATARARLSRVLVFDPINPRTSRCNPLAGLTKDDVDAVRSVTSALILEHELSQTYDASRFFIASALELATATALRVIELGTPTFAAAASFLCSPKWYDDSELAESFLDSEVAYVRETGAKYYRMESRVRSNILATVTHHLELFRSPAIANATADDDFSAATLRKGPTSLYLVVREADQRALAPVMRMVLGRLLDDLTRDLASASTQPILLMLDEFPLLRAPIIQQKLATLRKYRISAVLLAQSMSQIQQIYPNECLTGCCDIRVFFSSLDEATQRLASQSLGQTTRFAESISYDSTRKRSRAISEVGRPLLFPAELAHLGSEIIIAMKGHRPIKARRVESHRDARFKETA